MTVSPILVQSARLVEIAPTLHRPTQAGDLVLLVRELVVVRDLLVHADRLFGVDHDLLLTLQGHDLGVTVGLPDRRVIVG